MKTVPQEFTTFYIDPVRFDKSSLIAELNFRFDDKVHFTETIDFSSELAVVTKDWEGVEHLLAHLALSAGISYYKLWPTAEIHCTHI